MSARSRPPLQQDTNPRPRPRAAATQIAEATHCKSMMRPGERLYFNKEACAAANMLRPPSLERVLTSCCSPLGDLKCHAR